jgi:hypothetical protein
MESLQFKSFDSGTFKILAQKINNFSKVQQNEK